MGLNQLPDCSSKKTVAQQVFVQKQSSKLIVFSFPLQWNDNKAMTLTGCALTSSEQSVCSCSLTSSHAAEPGKSWYNWAAWKWSVGRAWYRDTARQRINKGTDKQSERVWACDTEQWGTNGEEKQRCKSCEHVNYVCKFNRVSWVLGWDKIWLLVSNNQLCLC